MKADTPSSVDQSPSAVVTGRGRGKGTTRKRKPKNPKTPPVNAQQTPQQIPGPQLGQGGPQQAGQQQVPNTQQQQQQQQQQQVG